MTTSRQTTISGPAPERSDASVSDFPPGKAPGIGTRLLALSALLVTAASLGWLALSLVRVFTDSWIAPIELSPDSDAVLSLNLQYTRQRAEIEQAEAEMARVEASIGAIDSGLERLRALRSQTSELYEYGAEHHGDLASGLGRSLTNLREERAILQRLVARQRTETERAEQHLASGLIERRNLEAEEQSLDSLSLQLVENGRAISELEAQRREARTSAALFQGSLDGTRAVGDVLPEIAQRAELDTRLEMEVLRLEAERRGLEAARAAGERSLAALHEVMAQIESRPLYRATREHMDVAFVPYEQLEGVQAGARLLQCEAGIFFCRDVGSISAVLPGEIVTQDPWGDLARGRYAVLTLTDAAAVQERILRAR